MSIGVGIGAFASGLAGGYGLGMQIEEGRERREARKLESENRQQMKDFNTSARAEFDQKVAAGEMQPGDIADFMLRYKGPQRTALFIEQGDYATAKAWNDWYRSEAAQEGSKLFGAALFKAQNGNLRGAVDDALKAGKVKGYLDHSYSVVSEDEIPGSDGQVAGYRLALQDNDGNKLQWDVTPENVETGIATLFNPEAAFQSRLDAKAARDKAEIDIDAFGKKEQIKDGFARGRELQRHDLRIKEQRTGGGEQPAEVKAAEWLASQLAATEDRDVTPQDRLKAHEQIKQAKSNPAARAGLVIRAYENMSKDYTDTRSPEEKRAAATLMVDELLASGMPGAEPRPSPGKPAPASEAPGLGDDPLGLFQ